jgi:hypothetical protein
MGGHFGGAAAVAILQRSQYGFITPGGLCIARQDDAPIAAGRLIG